MTSDGAVTWILSHVNESDWGTGSIEEIQKLLSEKDFNRFKKSLMKQSFKDEFNKQITPILDRRAEQQKKLEEIEQIEIKNRKQIQFTPINRRKELAEERKEALRERARLLTSERFRKLPFKTAASFGRFYNLEKTEAEKIFSQFK